MPTKLEIEQTHKTEHDRITKKYYQDKTLDKDTFTALHTALNIKLEDDLVAIGAYVRPPVPPPAPNWKALWLACGEITPESTITDKIAIIIKRQKLIAKKLELAE